MKFSIPGGPAYLFLYFSIAIFWIGCIVIVVLDVRKSMFGSWWLQLLSAVVAPLLVILFMIEFIAKDKDPEMQATKENTIIWSLVVVGSLIVTELSLLGLQSEMAKHKQDRAPTCVCKE